MHFFIFPGCVECDATAQRKHGCADVWLPCIRLRETAGRSAAAERHGGDETTGSQNRLQIQNLHYNPGQIIHLNSVIADFLIFFE